MQPLTPTFMNKDQCKTYLQEKKNRWEANGQTANGELLSEIILNPNINPAKKSKIVFKFLHDRGVKPTGTIYNLDFVQKAFNETFGMTHSTFYCLAEAQVNWKANIKASNEIDNQNILMDLISNDKVSDQQLFNFISQVKGLSLINSDELTNMLDICGRYELLSLCIEELTKGPEEEKPATKAVPPPVADPVEDDKLMEEGPAAKALPPAEAVVAVEDVEDENIESDEEAKIKLLNKLSKYIKTLAPNDVKNKTIKIGDETYDVWWNEKFKSFNIQKHENFMSKLPSVLRKEKISASIKDEGDEIKTNFYVDTVLQKELNDVQWALLFCVECELRSTVKLNKFIKELSDDVSAIAVTAKKPITCKVNGTSYKIWWNPFNKAVNIQKTANFVSRDPAICQKEKLGISLPDHRVVRFVDNVMCNSSEMPQQEYDFLLALQPQIKVQKEKFDEISNLDTCFNLDLLKLLKSYIDGPLGGAFRYDSNFEYQSADQLKCGTNPELRVWMKVAGAEVSGPSVKREYIINIQHSQDYRMGGKNNKLGININEDGEITSIFCDGQEVSPGDLFKKDSVWTKNLTNALHFFLKDKALKFPYTGYVELHSLVLSQMPQVVLNEICKTNVCKVDSIFFLNSELTRQPGTDAGGLTKQFFNEICRGLFSGKIIEMDPNSKAPKISKPEDAQILFNFGKLMASSLLENTRPKTGRIFNDNYFGLLKEAFLLGNNDLSKAQVINLSKNFLLDEQKWLFDVWKTGRAVTEEEGSILTKVLMMEDEAGEPIDFSKKDIVKQYIEVYLFEEYSPIVKAAHAMTKGMRGAGVSIYTMNLTTADLSKEIQGNAFSREEICSRMKTYSSNPVVHQKMAWLKEFIRSEDQSQEWCLKFLKTVTGQEVITAKTEIEIRGHSADTCLTHTCFDQIDVPTHHTRIGTEQGKVVDDKQAFFNNLLLTMAQEGFDQS